MRFDGRRMPIAGSRYLPKNILGKCSLWHLSNIYHLLFVLLNHCCVLVLFWVLLSYKQIQQLDTFRILYNLLAELIICHIEPFHSVSSFNKDKKHCVFNYEKSDHVYIRDLLIAMHSCFSRMSSLNVKYDIYLLVNVLDLSDTKS